VTWADPRLLAFRAPEALPFALKRFTRGLASVDASVFRGLPEFASSVPPQWLDKVPFLPVRDGLNEIRRAIEALEHEQARRGASDS
jgi:hypothetical protein